LNIKLPTFLHAGAQRSASTWTYNALKDHPEVFMPEKEPMSCFDCHYHKGISWYKKHFRKQDEEKAIGDESPGYIKHPLAPKRVAETIPNTKIIFCLRNPIERAYSQWWTAENAWTSTTFERALKRHSTNDVFITPGYYNYHISQWEKYFDKDQIKIKIFDDFVKDNKAYIQDLYEFIGVNKNYIPDVLNKKIKTNEKNRT